MKKFSELFPSLKTKTLKAGGYSILATSIVFITLVMVNVLVRALPANLTQFDMSAAKLYSISSQTKVVVNSLDKDVTIYYVCQAGEEDDVVDRLLTKYATLSDHLKVERKDPDVYPTFASNYTSGSVTNNSIIVECDNKYRYLDYNDIYVADGTEYASYYGNTTYSFDGEGLITSAISYVVSDDLPKLYLLSGHGEQELNSTLNSAIEKENYEIDTLSLLSESTVPEDCACLMIINPSSDLSSDEALLIEDYISDGGKLLAVVGPGEEGLLSNFASILEYYGVTTNEGIVIESDSSAYAFGYPYVLMPSLNEHEITSALISDNYYAIMPICSGYTISDEASGVTSLMDSTSLAYSKVAGYQLTTYEFEEDDIEGPFSMAVAIEDGDGQIVWFGSEYFLDEIYISYSSGANEDLLLNSLSYLVGKEDSLAIRAKSLSYEYLTISDSQSTFLKVAMIAVIPLIYLAYGIDNLLRRRKL